MDASAETLIDLDAVKGNVAALRRHVGGAAVMAVVKSDGYGHGMIPAARAALAGGASWLGVVTVAEAHAHQAQHRRRHARPAQGECLLDGDHREPARTARQRRARSGDHAVAVAV